MMKHNPDTPKKSKKKTKKPFVDDGHTVYDMSGLRGPGEQSEKENGVGLNRREKRAAIRAAFAHYLPILLLVILAFFGAMMLIRLWLHV